MTLDSSKKLTLASVNDYLASKGIKLSTQDKKRIASITDYGETIPYLENLYPMISI